MLRVITRRLGDGYRLELHGMLGGEWVRLLEGHWRAIVADAGVEFVVSGCLNRYVIEKLQPNAAATKE